MFKDATTNNEKKVVEESPLLYVIPCFPIQMINASPPFPQILEKKWEDLVQKVSSLVKKSLDQYPFGG